MSLVNNQLQPFERAKILRSLGFKINRNKGQVTGIKNVNYKDSNPGLSVNLDSGFVRDFGNSSYDGDVINLISMTIGGDFKEAVKYCEEILDRSLSDMDGMQAAGAMYGEPDIKNGEGGRKATQKNPVKKIRFWNTKKWERMMKCHSVLKDRGIPDSMKFIEDYDGISLETLLECNCGLYGYKDFEFGLSGKDYNDDLYFIFPYKSGAMLYRRNENEKKFFDKFLPPGKEVKNIKGSDTKESFFNINKDDEKTESIFVMKSPRECMNFMQYNTNMKIISIITGEEIGELTQNQIEQVETILSKNKPEINIVFDCNNPDDYDKSLKSAKRFSQAIPYALIKLVNIYKHTDGKHKDFTDLVQYSMKKKSWITSEYPDLSIDSELAQKFAKAINEAETIK